jgi:acyl carrier protein
MDSIESTVIEILSGKAKSLQGDLTLDTSLTDAGIDSLSMIELIFELEEAFGIEIPDPATVEDRTKAMKTPGDVVALIRPLIEAKEAGNES